MSLFDKKSPEFIMMIAEQSDRIIASLNKLESLVDKVEDLSDEVGCSYIDIVERFQTLRTNAVQSFMDLTDIVEQIKKAHCIEMNGDFYHNFEFNHKKDITNPDNRHDCLLILKNENLYTDFTVSQLQAATKRTEDGSTIYTVNHGSGDVDIKLYTMQPL